MKKLLSLSCFILLAKMLTAQNLLANAGFEDRNTCLEAHDSCNPSAWFRIPSDEIPRPQDDAVNGKYVEKIVMENVLSPVYYRSFIFTRLLCPLQKDTTYSLSIFIRAMSGDFHHLDLWMPAEEPYVSAKSINDITAQCAITNRDRLKKYNKNWNEYKISFKATGKEQFLMLGNFNKKPLTKPSRHFINNEVVYEIDSLELLPASNTKRCDDYESNLKELYSIHSRHSRIFFNNWHGSKDTASIKPSLVITPKANNEADTIILPDVLFEVNSSMINTSFKGILDSLAGSLAKKEILQININGHTDNAGAANYNLNLSQKRAEAVAQYLVDKEPLLKSILITDGFGDTRPKASNNIPEGRQLNRRVEIIIYYKKGR